MDRSITRMNLSAIKKIDPYAKDIVDSSSHVAFYTFNSEQNEWEKTDVEGAFFVYDRNAEPYHSIFINNRLNTTSFVEPITEHLELQSQPPFLLYRNERSRIRGFWFYNSEECDRISIVVNSIIKKKGLSRSSSSDTLSKPPIKFKEQNTSIFNMLSKAQQEYNSQNSIKVKTNHTTPCNVMQFFASAKPTTTSENLFNCLLSVDQLEKQQRSNSPNGRGDGGTEKENRLSPTLKEAATSFSDAAKTLKVSGVEQNISNWDEKTPNVNAEECLRKLLVGELRDKHSSFIDSKPSLLLPTMFDKPTLKTDEVADYQSFAHSSVKLPLDANQFVKAITYLLENDKEFVQKLHEAYLKTLTNSMFNSNSTYQ